MEKSIERKVFTIECEDVILREYTLEDLDAIYALTLQTEITDFLPDYKASREQRKYWMENYELKENQEFLQAVPNLGGEILRLGIILKNTKELIGWIVSGLKEELPPPNREIGYAISKDYRGRGYTTQAAKGLIRYLFKETNVEELSAIALTYNTASNKVIQKCGFVYLDTITMEDKPFYYYKLRKNEWIKNGGIE